MLFIVLQSKVIFMQNSDCLLVKTASEIALKSPFVRRFFTKKLVQSIKFALKRNSIECSGIKKGGGRLYVFCSNAKKAQSVLGRVSGIHATAIALHFFPASLEELQKQAVALAKKNLRRGNTFALDIRVFGNNAFKSKDLEIALGKSVQDAMPGLKVKLKNPEKEILIEVRKEDFFIYSAEQKGLGGLPLGAEGNLAFFFQGEKGELPAAFLLMHRGCNVFPVVKKKGGAMERFLRRLVPFNDYREFVLTEEKDFPQLVNERNIQAIATADSKTDEKSLAAYKEFNEKQSMVVLRPLLLYPKEKRKELEKLFH